MKNPPSFSGPALCRASAKVGTVLFSVFLMASCGGGDPEVQALGESGITIYGVDGQADQISAPWLAYVGTFRLGSRTPGTGDATVETLQYNGTRTLQDHIDWYEDQIVLETCEINEETTGGGSGSSNIPYVYGGDSVSINTASGTWHTIPVNSDLYYDDNNGLPGAIPQGATLSIPGGTFPAVAAYPLVEPAVPVGISPGRENNVDINSEYTWQAGTDPRAFMRMSLMEYDANGDFVDFRIRCDVVDDGSFVLPQDIIDFISNSSNNLRNRYTRTIRRIDYIDGVMFYQNASVAE